MSELVRESVDADSGVARLVLNRPERRNALSGRLVAALRDGLEATASDDRVRVVSIWGEGPDFCAGADLAEIREAVDAGVMENLRDADVLGDLFLRIRGHRKPVVAVVHGRALAGGCGLATACDLVVASETAEFGYPEVSIGFVPAMVMAILRRAVGEKRAFELVATGERISAERAREYGMVARVFGEDGFRETASRFLEELAGNSASAMTLSKRLLYHMDGQDFGSAVASGAEMNALARLTDDCRQGIERFLDR